MPRAEVFVHAVLKTCAVLLVRPSVFFRIWLKKLVSYIKRTVEKPHAPHALLTLSVTVCKSCMCVKMDVIKREEAKRVASGAGHFRPTSDELGLRVCTK